MSVSGLHTDCVEQVGSDAYLLTYTYGTDHQRAKSELKKNGNSIETRIYCGAYEEQRLPGTTNKIHYVNGPGGLCAMIVQAEGVETIYYVYKDHLGSIVTLTKAEQGGTFSVAARQNFDPWGRQRNPTDWTYGNLPPQPDWLYRGYTGHEHVAPFALINMNGRMYDPLNGRMLSPDNYVHGFLGSQGFNRYSYAGNNPLKYTDPSGEFIWFVAIGALIGSYLGGAIAAGDGGLRGADWNPFGGKNGTWSGDWWKGALTGAIIGASAGYGLAHLVGGAATQAALNTKLGITVGLPSKKIAISSVSSIIKNEKKGWDIWSTLIAAAASPFLSDLSFITGNSDLSMTVGSEIGANAVYGFIDRYTNPEIKSTKGSSRFGYGLIGAFEGAVSVPIFGGILSESDMAVQNASLFLHMTTAMPGFNESLARGAISPLTLFGTIPFDRWYLDQTNHYPRPFDLDNIIQWMLR